MSLWEAAGEPDLAKLEDVVDGDLIERRHGLRRDDLLEILLDPRAVPEGEEPMRRGRLLATHKTTIELLDAEGAVRYIARDAIVEMVVVSHLRPAYIDDEELHAFERDDGKRRSKLHEKAEKKDDRLDHAWG